MLIYIRKHLLLPCTFYHPQKKICSLSTQQKTPSHHKHANFHKTYGWFVDKVWMEREMKRERDKGESWKMERAKQMKRYAGREINKQKSSTKFCCREQCWRTEEAEDVKTSVTCLTQPHLRQTGVCVGEREREWV